MAADMLEAAGYHLVKPGVRTDPKGNRLEFDLTTNTGSPERDQMCTIFKQDLESLGIKVNYRPLEFTTLVDKLDSSFDWDCVLIGFTGGVEPNDGANFYRSSGNLHIWNPNQPTPATPWEAEIDTLLDQGASEMDLNKRRAVLLEDPANPPRSVADTRNGAAAALCVVEKLARVLSAEGLGHLQTGVDGIQGQLNIRRRARVEISGR